jgi:protein-S-isoprenylcysteine O-methyltransferase Ste14
MTAPATGRLTARAEATAVRRTAAADLAARAVVATLFTLLSINLLADFVRTGHVTGLLLLASESLIVVLTVVRRRAQTVDRSMAASFVTALSIVGPPLVRAADGPGLVPDAVTATASAMGLAVVIVGKLALGRSFGIVPANRGVVARGPYMVVRHPIYAGYVVTHLAFLAAHPQPWNVCIVAVADVALVVRAFFEERVLSADVGYRSYCRRVEWHFVPGVF